MSYYLYASKVTFEYKPEEIGGLKEYPPDQRDAMIAAIMKEIGDLCKIGVFSLEVIPDQSKPLSTKLVLKINTVTLDMYLPLSKFESIQRVSLTLRCNNNLL